MVSMWSTGQLLALLFPRPSTDFCTSRLIVSLAAGSSLSPSSRQSSASPSLASSDCTDPGCNCRRPDILRRYKMRLKLFNEDMPLPRFLLKWLQAVLAAFGMAPCCRVPLGHVLPWIYIVHVPLETLALERVTNVQTNREITRGHGSRIWPCAIIKVWVNCLSQKLICESFTFIIVHPRVNKSIVVFDEHIIGALWPEIIWMIITEDVADLDSGYTRSRA